ncbi:DEAD/DEAH box helicase [uncultured Clostridium sp.]|uniref:DEAD/DEAH box helicase n=1 Tax=uncultured Clostridium sp. TaxID=59620 RepID=UPI0025FA2492|nr:DEAD/DEAH box helicase [uncultured Clostridium sp.]
MKISEIEDIIIKSSSKINITRGKKINEDKVVNIDIRKVENFYNIYGSFNNESSLKKYKPHLRIDLKKKKIVFAKCNCSIFEKNYFNSRIYMCEHLVAAGFKFINDVKKRLASRKNAEVRNDKELIKELRDTYLMYTDEKEKVICSKEKLTINISLKEVKEHKDNLYDISLFIGNTHMYPVLDIKEFIMSWKNKKQYCIGKGFLFDNDKYLFDENDMEILDYIYEFILINNNNENKNHLRIHCLILKRILRHFDGRQIKFNYNYVNYLSRVYITDLPLSFTMKKINGNYVLTTKKVFPIPLNDNMDLFLYDRNLYIPSSKQIDLYRLIYTYLKENKKIVFKGDIDNEEFSIINKVITSISQNISYDEAIIEKMNEDVEISFDFSRKRGISICNVKIKSSVAEMDYSDAVKINNNNFKVEKKLANIERILNKYRFYYRNEVFEFLGEDEEYYNFLKTGMDEIKRIGKVFTNKQYSEYFRVNNGNFKEFSIKENNKGMYDFYMELENISPNELNEVVRAYKENKSYIKLNDNVYVDLESSEIKKAMKIIESLNLNVMQGKGKFELSFDKLYYLKEKVENDQLISENRKKMIKVFEEIDKKQDENYEIPKTLNCDLKEYQKKGYNWLKNLSELGLGGILGDEMGLGKTVQTIAFLASEEKSTSLIIVPTSLLYNWKEEFSRFAPDLQVCIVHGEKKDREKLLEDYSKYDVMITTYGTLKNDCSIYEEIEFKNIILDEGQNIKNHKAVITGIVKKLKSRNRFILTGTPIENSLNELWSLFDFIMPGYLYSHKEFNDKFVKDDSNIEELRILIKPYILRRAKKEAAEEMPEKHENKILVKMTAEQKAVYDAFVKQVYEEIEKSEINNMTIFSYLTNLRQLCLDPSLISGEYTGESCKINKVLEIIKNAQSKKKILLFSQFTTVLKKLASILEDRNIEYCYLDGSISSAERMKIVDQFNNNEEKRVFLISLKAGGSGLNLASANMVIHFDPWWNPSIEDQATDRAHRIGQTKDVQVIKLIAENTIEEKILLLQEDKRKMINDVLTNELKDSNVLNWITSRELIDLMKE